MGFLKDTSSPVFIAGHRGLIGSAIVRNLRKKGFQNLILKTHKELDLQDSSAVKQFFKTTKPKYVFLAAAKVGGIKANQDGLYEFLLENMQIQNNVIHSAYESGVEKLLFLGSSCIYPKLANQPLQETSLLSGPLEITNEGYAIAKIAGLKLCEYINRQKGRPFISAMPTNLYGPNDNFHPMNSHVIPGMITKFEKAKTEKKSTVTLWGTGSPKREFLYADDCADALVFLMDRYNESSTINVGSGEEVTIKDLALLIKEVTGFSGDLAFDPQFPDGTPRKVLDVSKLKSLGWKPKFSLKEGIELQYSWALKHGALKNPETRVYTDDL